MIHAHILEQHLRVCAFRIRASRSKSKVFGGLSKLKGLKKTGSHSKQHQGTRNFLECSFKHYVTKKLFSLIHRRCTYVSCKNRAVARSSSGRNQRFKNFFHPIPFIKISINIKCRNFFLPKGDGNFFYFGSEWVVWYWGGCTWCWPWKLANCTSLTRARSVGIKCTRREAPQGVRRQPIGRTPRVLSQ